MLPVGPGVTLEALALFGRILEEEIEKEKDIGEGYGLKTYEGNDRLGFPRYWSCTFCTNVIYQKAGRRYSRG